MHGCSSTSVLIVNAEVDSMGGVVEGGVGIANKTSPRKAAIEKVQAELWQKYGVRDLHKRELEFLEKGGDPLEFTPENVASVSVQSTSITVQPHNVTGEAKGSFAFTASPHGDSVESSGRPGTTPCEPNSADNLMLFDNNEHGFSEGDRSLSHPSRSVVAPSEQSLQVGGSHKTQANGDLATFNPPKKAYKRRNRSRPNRDGGRSSSADLNPTRGSNGSSLPSRHGPRDVKGLESDAENQNIDTIPMTVSDNGQDDIGLDKLRSAESTQDLVKVVSVDSSSNHIASNKPLHEQVNRKSFSAASKPPNQIGSNETEAAQVMEEINSASIECQPSATATNIENQSSPCQMNGFGRKKGDEMKNDAHNSSAVRDVKVLDSESSCMQTSLTIGGNNSEMCTRRENVDLNGNRQNQDIHDENPVLESDKCVKEKKDIEGTNSYALVKKGSASASQSLQDNGFSHLPGEELNRSDCGLENKVKDQLTQLDSERKLTDLSVDNPGGLHNEICCDASLQDVEVSNADLPEAGLLTKVSTSPEAQTSSGSESTLAKKIDEDSILKEAEIIEAKRKRIAELSIVTSATVIRQKSHWDYVLEEMAWLANDFAQERIWKIAAASQMSYRVAVTCRLRKQGKKSDMDTKTVAHTMAKAVMEFWHSVELQIQETSKELEQQRQKSGALSVRAYAVRLLKCMKPNLFNYQAEVPLTPDRISDLGVMDLSWEDNMTEENLFYTVPGGAVETYRKSVESHVAHCEKIGSTVQEEVETSVCDVAADSEYQDNAYDDDEGEISTYNTPVAFESCKSSRYCQKKRKQAHAYGPGSSYEIGSDLLPIQCAENSQQSTLPAHRPGSTLNVSIPTKRVRTASRRVISPFTAGASVPIKTDASSCDTNSFQDDRGLLFPNSLEVESAGDFENKLPFDSVEVSTRPKKKKKAKHLNASYEQRWQVDSSFQNEQFQRDPVKKRLESHQLESNGNSGLLGQPMIKKPKLMRHSQDNSFDNIPPSGGSVPSPVASQISNMSNPNKFIKMLGGRDRSRKAKGLKMPSGQPGSGGPWSLFEDQALVVLVHDLGPNWELISDALNSTLHFKCIFRKAKECKERHNFLMDGASGDGAESAEDSGSSQPYPSTLPGIPKGSARQLFQRLQGPMEEDTLKSHFEKIIMIGQKQQYRKTQDPKQLQQPHSSHTVALSHVFPNNLNGGHVLTPLDLCDASDSGPDILSLGYQGPHPSGLPIPNQGTVNPMLPASGASNALQGSPNMMIGNNFPSSPGTLNPSGRDGRYVGPRPGSLSGEEQHRFQQYNQMIPGRSMPPQPNISAPSDRGVRIVPGGNGMGMMCGAVNRSLPMARPGFQGIPGSSLVNSGSMVSPVMSSSANMHTGQGSSMLKPRETLHMMRPGLNQDSQRQTMMPDLQIPGNSQLGSPHFSNQTPPFPNQISPQQPQVLSPHHTHFQGPATNQPSNTHQQAYAIRLAKERQLQHRLLQQQLASNPLMPHVQSQPQLPVSSPMQNNSQVQTGKQKQKHQFSQANNRQHPQQRHQLQGQQQQQANKAAKGVGRGNTNISTNQAPSSSRNLQITTSQPDSNNSCQQKPAQQKLANHNQPVIQRVVQPNRHITTERSIKPQVKDSDTDQHPTGSSADVEEMTTLPPACNNTKNAPQVVSDDQQMLTSSLHSQQQPQVLEAGNNNLYGRSSEPRLE